jgi:Protein of unknown function (DUF4236)
MGFRFRRSVPLLPGVRLNLSGSGASVSLGPRGFHYTIGGKGTRVTAGIPGTGLSWTQYTAYSQSRSIDPAVPAFSVQSVQGQPVADLAIPSLNAIESAPAEQINTFSVSELAPILNAANRKIGVAPFVQLVSLFVFLAAVLQANQLSIGLSALYATVMIPIGIFLDRYRRSVKIAYEPHGATGQIAEALKDSFGDLINSHAVWRVRAEGSTSDWKRNAGATTLSQRKKVKAQFGKPDCIRGRSQFPALKLGSDEIYFLPDAALVIVRGSVAAVHYRNLEVSKSAVRFIEAERVPEDSPTVGQTWRYVNKNGGPDRRFNFNAQLPICLYGEVSFQSEGGLSVKIQCSNPSAPDRLCAVIEVLHRSNAELPKAITYVGTSSWWPTALFLSCMIGLAAGQVSVFSKDAYRRLSRPVQASGPMDAKEQMTTERPPANAQVRRPAQERLPESRDRAFRSEPLNILPPMIESGPSPVAREIENIAPLAGAVPLPRPRPKAAPGPQYKSAAE